MSVLITKVPEPFFKRSGILIGTLVVSLQTLLFGQTNWSVNTSVAYSSGKYIYDNNIENYYLNLGLTYQKSDLYLSTAVPFVIQKSTVGTMNAGGMSVNSNSSTISGISDIYLYGEYNLLNSGLTLPEIAIQVQIKIPTAAKTTLLSSGKFDYGGGFALRKMYGSYKIFADAGYLILGDPEELNYNNPFSFGLGAGKYLEEGNSSISLYYQVYSEIISGINAPEQLTFGYIRKISKISVLSVFVSKGFGEGSPAFNISSGINVGL